MMNTMNRICVWNCLVEANTSFYRYCKQYVETWKPAMLVILETRCDHNKLTKTFTLLGYDGVLSSEVQGYAGGIIVVWKTEFFEVHLLQKKFQFLHLKVSYPRGKMWLFTAVYASPNEDNRRIL
jgi:exonuclease III